MVASHEKQLAKAKRFADERPKASRGVELNGREIQTMLTQGTVAAYEDDSCLWATRVDANDVPLARRVRYGAGRECIRAVRDGKIEFDATVWLVERSWVRVANC